MAQVNPNGIAAGILLPFDKIVTICGEEAQKYSHNDLLKTFGGRLVLDMTIERKIGTVTLSPDPKMMRTKSGKYEYQGDVVSASAEQPTKFLQYQRSISHNIHSLYT